MYDIAIIGAGIIGASVAEQLSHYDISVCLLEKETDVADGTTKANSGIVHAGYDAKPGTNMAKLNVRGSQKMGKLCKNLGVGYNNCGSLVLAFTPDEMHTLETLKERGEQNGVQGLCILTADEVRKKEPNISENVLGALYAPSAAIVDPFALCVALCETAALNGVAIFLDSEVTSITNNGDHFTIYTPDQQVKARWIVNAAGVHADQVHDMVGEHEFSIRPVRGEYYIMDKEEGDLVSSVVFQCPSAIGKGVLVSPTVHGNLIVGPNAEDVDSPDDVATTAAGQDFVRATAARSVPDINYRYAIRNFAGVRAYSDSGDFVIAMAESVPHFIDLAGICSPGLSASPAIAETCVELLEADGLKLEPKKDWKTRPIPVRIKELSSEEKQKAIDQNPLYGHVICRCETVTEGEIVDALHRAPVAGTVDSIKKRLGPGMGRCQGGFCMPRVMDIISRELGKDPKDILLNKKGTHILDPEA